MFGESQILSKLARPMRLRPDRLAVEDPVRFLGVRAVKAYAHRCAARPADDAALQMPLEIERQIEAPAPHGGEKARELGCSAITPEDQSLVDRGVTLEKRRC